MTDVAPTGDMSDHEASQTAALPTSEAAEEPSKANSPQASLPEPMSAPPPAVSGHDEDASHAEEHKDADVPGNAEAASESGIDASPDSRKRQGSPGVHAEGRDKRPRNEEESAVPPPSATASSSAHAAGDKPTASQLKDTIAHNVNAGNLDVYVWEYLKRRNLTKTAASLVEETGLPPEPDVPIRLPRGLLFEYWTLFWDLFRSRVGLGTREAALFGDYLENRRRQAIQEAKTKTFTAPLFPDASTGLPTAASAAPATGLSLGLAAAAAAPLATDAAQSLMLSQDPTGVPALGPAAPIVSGQPGAGASPTLKMQRSSSSPSSPATQSGVPSTPASSAQHAQAPASAPAANTSAATMSSQTMVPSRAPAVAQTPSGTPAPPTQPQRTPQMRGQSIPVSAVPPNGTPMAHGAPLSMKPAPPPAMAAGAGPASQSAAQTPATPSLQQQQQMQMQMQLQMQMQQALARGQVGQGINPAMLTPQQQQQLLVTAAMRQGIPLEELKNMAPAARMALLNSVLPNTAQTAAMAAMQAQGPRGNDPQLQARLLLQQQQLLQMQNHAGGQSKTAPSSPAAFQALFNRPGQRMATPSQLGTNKPVGNGADHGTSSNTAGDPQAAQHGLGQRPMGMQMPVQLTPQQRQMLLMQYQTLQTAMKNEWMKAQSAPVPAMAQQCMATVQQLQAKLQSMAALLQSDPTQQSGPTTFSNDGQNQAMLQHLQQQAHMSNGAGAALLGQTPLGPMMNAQAQGQAARPNGFGEVDVHNTNAAMASYFGMGANGQASLPLQQQQRRAPGQTPAPPSNLGVRPPLMGSDSHAPQGMVANMMPQAARGSVTAPATPQAAHATAPSANGAGPASAKGARGGPVRPPAMTTPGRPEVPMSPWQPPSGAQDSPSNASGKKDRPRKPGRPASNKTPVLPTRTPWGEASQEEAVPKEEPSEWDANKGESDLPSQARSGSGDGQAQSILDSMPSMMDDVTSGLAMSSGTGLSSHAPAGSANDDFSAMFGVSDIFDFDFDGGDAAGSQASGLFAGTAPAASEASDGAAGREATGA